MARKTIEIPGIVRCDQQGTTIYIGSIRGDQLVQIAVHCPFGEHPDGLNRKLTLNRAKEIARALEEDDAALMRDSIAGDLRTGDEGVWIYDEERNVLIGEIESDEGSRKRGCYLLLDDGLHRASALEMVSGETRANWTFPLLVTMDAPWEERARAFVQQEKRKKQDPRLMLQVYERMNCFPNRATRVAYRTARRLDSESSSPFHGKIRFDQMAARRGRLAHGEVDVNKLFSFLKTAVGRQSTLHGMDEENQIRAITEMFRAAASAWSHVWGQEGHPLSNPLGWDALIVLLSRGALYNMTLARDYSYANQRRIFDICGKHFKWELDASSGRVNPNSLGKRLDEHIGRHRDKLSGNGLGHHPSSSADEGASAEL